MFHICGLQKVRQFLLILTKHVIFSRYKCKFISQHFVFINKLLIINWSFLTFSFLAIMVRNSEVSKHKIMMTNKKKSNKCILLPPIHFVVKVFCIRNVMTQTNICNMSIKMYFKSRIFRTLLEKTNLAFGIICLQSWWRPPTRNVD